MGEGHNFRAKIPVYLLHGGFLAQKNGGIVVVVVVVVGLLLKPHSQPKAELLRFLQFRIKKNQELQYTILTKLTQI